MKRQRKTWEIILAGCALTALSIYVMNPVQPTTSHSDQQKLHQETISIDMKQLPKTKEIEQIEDELKKAEQQLEEASLKLEQLALPSLKKLPQILIHSN